MSGYNVNRPLAESMTADELSFAQTEHYQIDDNFRRMLSKMTIEQKRKVSDMMLKMLSIGGE